jgi:hypothetical protein
MPHLLLTYIGLIATASTNGHTIQPRTYCNDPTSTTTELRHIYTHQPQLLNSNKRRTATSAQQPHRLNCDNHLTATTTEQLPPPNIYTSIQQRQRTRRCREGPNSYNEHLPCTVDVGVSLCLSSSDWKGMIFWPRIISFQSKL